MPRTKRLATTTVPQPLVQLAGSTKRLALAQPVAAKDIVRENINKAMAAARFTS